MFCLRNVSPTLDHLFTHCSDKDRTFITTVSHQIYGIITRNEVVNGKGKSYIKVQFPLYAGGIKKVTYGIKVNPDIFALAQKNLFSIHVRKELAHLIQCCLLTHACFTKHVPFVEHILNGKEVDLDRCLGVEKAFHEWNSLLHGACNLGSIDIVKLLLKANIHQSSTGQPTLAAACFSNSPNKLRIVELLLESGEDPDAAWDGNLRILNCLVYSVVKIKKDPLFFHIIERLLAAGADTNHYSFLPFERIGTTLLDNVCTPGMPMSSLVQQLIWCGAKGSLESAEFSGFKDIFQEATAQRKSVLEGYQIESESLDKLKVRKVSHDVVKEENTPEDPLMTIAKTVIYRRSALDLENELNRLNALRNIPTALLKLVSSYCSMAPLELNKKLQCEALGKCKDQFMVL